MEILNSSDPNAKASTDALTSPAVTNRMRVTANTRIIALLSQR
jgi:hypothetical protein